jgi:hypothetical protein
MAVAMSNIDTMLARTGEVTPYNVNTNTDLSNSYIGTVGNDTTVHYSAINLQANTELEIRGNVTIITSEAMTMGAGAEIVLVDDATVTWILGGSLNLGAGSEFSGATYVKGAVNGATSDIACGNLFATGAVSLSTLGGACPKPVVQELCPLWSTTELKIIGDMEYFARTNDYAILTIENWNHLDGLTFTDFIITRIGADDEAAFISKLTFNSYAEREIRMDTEGGGFDSCKSTLIDEIDSRS